MYIMHKAHLLCPVPWYMQIRLSVQYSVVLQKEHIRAVGNVVVLCTTRAELSAMGFS
jgi:hypothetical protein